MGDTTTASGRNALAAGFGTSAIGINAVSLGNQNESSGFSSISIGDHTLSSGTASFSAGFYTEALGSFSTTFGNNTIAEKLGQFSIGSFNTRVGGSNNSNTAESPVFVVGNGTGETNRKDAFVIRRNGNTEINGLVTINPNNNDTGYVLPVSRGLANQVLTANADGSTQWTNNSNTSQSVFNSVSYQLPNSGGLVQSITEDEGAQRFMVGIDNLTYTEGTSPSSFLNVLTYDRGAFRAGGFSENRFAINNIGFYWFKYNC